MSHTVTPKSLPSTLKSRIARMLLSAPVVALALFITPATTEEACKAEVAALSKRFMRFNEYLFNGVQHGTAIASVEASTHTSHT